MPRLPCLSARCKLIDLALNDSTLEISFIQRNNSKCCTDGDIKRVKYVLW